MIIEEKVREQKKWLKNNVNRIMPVESAHALSSIDLTRKYMWAMSSTNQDATKKLGLTSIKKY